MDSIYERNNRNSHLQKSGIALGKITSVDAAKRFCEVKTFFGDPGLIDRHLSKVQWLSTDANPEGDESTSIPRVGSTGLVFFVGAAAFIWGYFKATDPKKGAVTGKEQTDLNVGDKVIATVGGNRIAVKANGSIEILSKETLKTIFFPKDGLLAHICEAYQLKGDGGTVTWKTISDLNETLYRHEFRKDLARTSIIVEEKGAVDATTIRKIAIGPGIPGTEGVQVPVYEEITDITGKTTLNIGLAGTGITEEKDPVGKWKLNNLFSHISLSEQGDWEIATPVATIKASATGDIEATNGVAKVSLAATGDIETSNPAGKMTIANAGDIEISNPIGKTTIAASGEIEVANAVSKLKIDPAGMIGLGGKTAELLDLFDQLLDAFINQPQLTMTGAGPSGPLNPPAMTNLIKVKALLNTIKGSV